MACELRILADIGMGIGVGLGAADCNIFGLTFEATTFGSKVELLFPV